jgi:AcrR family transcriptional regulator
VPKATWWNLPADKRRRVVEAAMAEFGERGFSAGSLNVIAREARIAKGSLFQYFEDKLDLFATICEWVSEEAIKAIFLGIDQWEDQPYFALMRKLFVNWIHYFRREPVARGIAMAVKNEMDIEVRATVRSVTNTHYVDVLMPLAKRAIDRGEFRPRTSAAQVVAMSVLLFRHLDEAPFYPHIDPVLGLYEKTAKEVDRIALDLVAALERAYAKP